MSTQRDFKPFRLMDLPAELRLMIYKRLPRQIKHTELRYVYPHTGNVQVSVDSKIILITRHLPTAILRTSHQVYAEAHAIVSAILQTFVVKSQPRIIGHDVQLEALEAFLPHIVAEYDARIYHSSYYLSDFGKRHCDFNRNPWATERSDTVARFLLQTAFIMTSPVHTREPQSIAIASFTDFDSTKDRGRTLAQRCWLGRTRIEHELAIHSGFTNEIPIDQDLWLVHAPGEGVKLTTANIPVKPDMDKFYESMGDELSICMSQETWVEEWLPSL